MMLGGKSIASGVKLWRYIEMGLFKHALKRSLHNEPSPAVLMSYKIYNPKLATRAEAKELLKSEDVAPIMIMHGLLGSKSNWNSLSKEISKRTSRRVIAVDARNHGDSPSVNSMSYEEMYTDVIHLTDYLELRRVVLLGHSMGGRVMMKVALEKPELVEKLIVVDISPVSISQDTRLMPNFIKAFINLRIPANVPLSALRKAANEELKMKIPEDDIRLFMLTNLVENSFGEVKWRHDLKIILKYCQNVFDFHLDEGQEYPGPTLFACGEQSDYVRREDHESIRMLFPGAKFHYIEGAGHWVHANKPQEFLKLVVNFIND